MHKTSITLRHFRDKLADLVMFSERPIVITKDQIPLGFFVPAKVWLKQSNAEVAKDFVNFAVEHSGCDKKEIEQCMDAYLATKRVHVARGG